MSPSAANKSQQLEDKLRVLREEYVRNLSSKITQIETLWKDLVHISWQQDNIATLHRHTHSLVGSGSTFGFTELSGAARSLDNELKTLLELTHPPDKEIQAVVDEKLIHLLSISDSVDSDDNSNAIHTEIEQQNSTEPELNTENNRVLFIHDHANNEAQSLIRQIEQYGHEIKQLNLDEVSSHQQTLELVTNWKPHLVILDSVEKDLNIHSEICEQFIKIKIPILFITEQNTIHSRLQAVRLGGQAYFTKPVDVASICDSLDTLNNDGNKQSHRVLIVEDTQELVDTYTLYLQQAGMQTRAVTNPLLTLDAIIDFNPDLVLMDMYMPHCTGRELATVIRQQESYASLPIVFLSAEADLNKQLAAMSLGGDDFLTKPIEPDHLVAAVQIRAKRYRELRSYMDTDSLTGLLNHAKIEEHLEIEIARAQRTQSQLIYAILDIDHFKSVNDTYGHAVGDKVIKSLSRLLQQSLRKTDVIGRYGGEEFVVILGNTDLQSGVLVLEKIRKKFQDLQHHSNNKTFNVTFSCGLADYPNHESALALHNNADKALYQAKNAGRNKIIAVNSDFSS